MGFLTTIDLSDSLPPVLGFVDHFPKTAIVGKQWPATGPRKPVCPEFSTEDIRTCTGATTPENRRQTHQIACWSYCLPHHTTGAAFSNGDFGAQYWACTFLCQRL